MQECNIKVNQLSSKLKQQDDDISHLREELERLLTELSITRTTLKEIVDKLVLYIVCNLILHCADINHEAIH